MKIENIYLNIAVRLFKRDSLRRDKRRKTNFLFDVFRESEKITKT